MPPKIHVLTSSNTVDMTGICRKCGPVDLLIKNGPRCGNAVRAQRKSPGRHSKVRTGHRWPDKVQPHGLTISEAKAYREGKVCEICGTGENLNVDHCHKTRERRGVLCNSHNRALGLFGDSVEYLEAAIAYLRKGAPVGGRDGGPS